MPWYANCDEGAYHAESTKATSLTPNQFHKLCPGKHTMQSSEDGSSSSSSTITAFGQPGCGDGSSFSFLFSRPMKQRDNDKKIIVEFQGGGACWNQSTCEMQQAYLSFPDYYDSFVGMSCSEIEYGAAVQGGNPLSLLCAKSVGGTDFTEYNTIVVPYCTQDVHIGDAPNVSYDGGSSVVNHVGAHNMMRTLNWIFNNFPNPTHIFLTGCSAGGTAVPTAYDLMNKHYNSFLKGGPRAVNINAIMDSSVYLTPSYFLQNGFPNWHPGTIMKRLGFNYAKHKYDENYPDLVWNHILSRGSNTDHWGFVTHSSDPVSLAYYQYMSGSGGNEGRSLASVSPLDHTSNGSHRRMDDDSQSQWWTEIDKSMTYIKNKHNNVDTYVIEGEGHCSFGLYYPLQEESFETWAANVVKERMVIGNRRPAVASFLASLIIGGMFVIITRRSRQKGVHADLFEMRYNLDSSLVGETEPKAAKRICLGLFMEKIDRAMHPLASRCQSWPWTAGFLLSTTIYFISMLISQGFTHPLDNLAFGPSAVGLSTFGINNPALVIYRMEHFRLVTTSFLCSGVIPYLLVAFAFFRTGVEAAMSTNNHPCWHFLLVVGMISAVSNLGYACIGNGASCSSLALALGLNVFSATMRRRSMVFNSPLRFTIVAFILGCTPLLPFESWISLTAAVLAGALMGLAFFVDGNGGTSEVESNPPPKVRSKFVLSMGIVQLMMYILLLLRIPSPDKRSLYPYQTGCGVVYSDQVGDIVDAYTSGDRRVLEEEMFDSENLCAQTCIPHVAYRLSLWGASQFSPFTVKKGTCEDNGYDVHIVDKTYQKYSVVFEVQLYSRSNNNARV